MQTRRLGSTDLMVSKLCLGTMTFGEQNTEAEAHKQMDMALAQGINFFDVAEMYPVPPRPETQGLSERYIGSWFKARGTRDKIIIATKVAGPADWLAHIRNGPQLTKAHLCEAVDASLARLQTETIDLYQIHWPSRQTNYFGQLGYQHDDHEDLVLETETLTQTLSVMNDLMQAGKIKHFGLSNETPWGAMKAITICEQQGWAKPVSIQNPYNLLNRSYEVGLAEISHRENMGLLAYSPLAFGY